MRLQEIETRLAEINVELEIGGASITEARITELETEVAALVEERTALENVDRRSRLLASVAAGNPIMNDDGSMSTARVVRSFRGTDGERQDGIEGGDVDKFGTMAYRRAFMNYVCRGTELPVEYRANQVSTTTDVGAAIPSTILDKIVEKLESTGMILARVTRTAYKGGVSIPVSTVKPVASWVSEGAGSDTQKKSMASSGMLTFAYHKLRCAVAVSVEVDTMAIAAFEKLLLNNIVEAMTKALEQAIISGTGTGQPKGIITETANTDQVISTSTQSYSNLISAEAALPVAYEKGAEWCMSKKTFMGFYGLTDTNGQPIGRINYGIAGKPEYTLLGRPVVICDYLTSFSAATAGTVVGFLFNFKDYVLNTNYAMGVKKYEDNETDDKVTKGIMLVDGKVVDVNSLVTIKKVASA